MGMMPLCLVKNIDGVWTIIDAIGEEGDDPGDGWDVAGIAGATKNHTFVRKLTVISGNPNWSNSAGTNEENSEWIVYPEDTLDHIGEHQVVFDLPSPTNVQIAIVNDSVFVTWGSVEYATIYNVYSSNQPYTGYEKSATISDTIWTSGISDSAKFYKVTAEY